ncbi:DUF1173 domain-containing protein [Paraburkholderia dioscoreae]|uniref:DUF1173 domain-containing protein n=1 Tax=Paraburkholderia dioscoreae TaxID=2604047 RepID=A0A5Q4ZQL6_9BURK|nr:DUF1173 domain-containing protein [Paraburkholderia dioscoreae]VVD30920.1 conserved protein of unknown function [Paraburkholderia dioscoreae]
MHQYSIDGRVYNEDDPGLQAALGRVHHTKIRPLCLCVRPGAPMYVSKVSGHFQIKRMPESGADHSADCDSYEPPAELSGLGEVMGHAIKEDVEEGMTMLKLDFALNKIAGRAPPAPSESEQGSIKADSSKLTIRSLLHFLWDESHLTHWNPGMQGKRSWATVHKYLSRAAHGKITKGLHLPTTLYVPEPFYVDRKDEITQRRKAFIAGAEKSDRPGQKLFIVIGEVKEVTAARYGRKMILKQVPDFFFMISEDLNKKLKKVFTDEVSLWNAFPEIHLVTIATFSIDPAGVAQIEEMAFMVTTEHWVPFTNVDEKNLIETLIASGRRFVKGQRYNLPASRPLASVILSDTQPKHTAMYLVPSNASEDYMAALNDLTESSPLKHLRWISGDVMPEIPPAVVPSRAA